MDEKNFRFAEPAQLAYAAAIRYLLEHNLFTAERFVEEVDAAIERICRFPESGSLIREDPQGAVPSVLGEALSLHLRDRGGCGADRSCRAHCPANVAADRDLADHRRALAYGGADFIERRATD